MTDQENLSRPVARNVEIARQWRWDQERNTDEGDTDATRDDAGGRHAGAAARRPRARAGHEPRRAGGARQPAGAGCRCRTDRARPVCWSDGRHRGDRAEAQRAPAGCADRGVGNRRRRARGAQPSRPRSGGDAGAGPELPKIGHDPQPVAVPARRRHHDLLDRRRTIRLDGGRRRRLRPLGRGVR